jgi:RNA polymerase sigma-70 factor (ECF subfamily)
MPSAEALLAPSASTDDARLIDALRRGDETVFGDLIDRYGPTLLSVATRYVGSRAVAEEVVQDTWVGLLRGIDEFEGRSSLKTWLFRILVNTAMSRSRRERRCMPFSSLGAGAGAGPGAGPDHAEGDTAVDPERFIDAADHRWRGGWAAAPSDWATIPEERLLSAELLQHVSEAIDTLPERQRQVIVLRDVEGWSSGEVREWLELSEANQRVLLHRARSKVRAALERQLG